MLAKRLIFWNLNLLMKPGRLDSMMFFPIKKDFESQPVKLDL